VSGVIAKRSVQVGQRVAAGSPLMALVPLDDVWVDANFKEVQLRSMRVGQPVALHADLYGNGVDFHGRLAGLSAGSGSAFALLPPQNASGNWIKIVQRLPVRITLDPQEFAGTPAARGFVDDRQSGRARHRQVRWYRARCVTCRNRPRKVPAMTRSCRRASTGSWRSMRDTMAAARR